MFHYFTIKFHFSFFASFCFFLLQIFASLYFSNFCFEAKQSEAKFKSIFSLFSLFSLFFAFFRFFRFFSLFSLFSLFFAFFRFEFFASLWFRFRFFRLIFAYFTFVFASDFWYFTSKWIMWNQAFFSLPSETKFSLQFQISLPKRKWGRTLPVRQWHRLMSTSVTGENYLWGMLQFHSTEHEVP